MNANMSPASRHLMQKPRCQQQLHRLTHFNAATCACLVQGFAAFPLVTIGVTNTEVTATAMQMMVPQSREWTAPD